MKKVKIPNFKVTFEIDKKIVIDGDHRKITKQLNRLVKSISLKKREISFENVIVDNKLEPLSALLAIKNIVFNIVVELYDDDLKVHTTFEIKDAKIKDINFSNFNLYEIIMEEEPPFIDFFMREQEIYYDFEEIYMNGIDITRYF